MANEQKSRRRCPSCGRGMMVKTELANGVSRWRCLSCRHEESDLPLTLRRSIINKKD